MTREDAIKLLELLATFTMLEESKECYELAIEALKEPDIIRCSECRFCVAMSPNYTWCNNHKIFVEPGDFCSYGSEEGDDNAD